MPQAANFFRFAPLLCALAVSCTSCERKPAPGAPRPPPPANVVVRTMKPQTVPITYEFVGQTAPSKMVEVRARVQGFLLKREFEEGTLVEEGQSLYQIDPRSFAADVEVAKAQRERARVQLGNATRQVERITELAKQQAATPKELDDWQTNQLQARADLRLWEAQVALAELNYGYTNITSPLRGKVGRTLKDVGALVDSGSNSLLTTVRQVDPMYVIFSIPEREWLQWKEDVEAKRIVLPNPDGMRVELILLDGTRYQTTGKLDFFDADVNIQTGTVLARAVFDNKTLPPKPGATTSEEALKPGQFVRAHIIGWERPDALAVPQRAVIQTANGPIVMVVGAGDRVEVRPIKAGSWFADEWIVSEGLRPGDRVVVEGFAKAPPGSVVSIAGEYVGPASAPATPAGATPSAK